MAGPSTNNNELPQQVAEKATDVGFFDADWNLVASGFTALAGWIGAHWADVGLGLVAVAFTLLGTQVTKAILDWVIKRLPKEKFPNGLEDDTYTLLVRGMVLVWGTLWAGILGFPEHFGAAIGVDLSIHENWALLAGGLTNWGIALVLWHTSRWLLYDKGPMASFLRQTFRAKFRFKVQTATGVTDEQLADHSTGMVVLSDLQPEKEEADGEKN